MSTLSDAQIEDRLEDLEGWEREGDTITKTYRLESFAHALAFVSHVGTLAEVAGHHPDIDIRYWDVTLTLTTHDEGGLTDRDFSLASEIEIAGWPRRED